MSRLRPEQEEEWGVVHDFFVLDLLLNEPTSGPLEEAKLLMLSLSRDWEALKMYRKAFNPGSPFSRIKTSTKTWFYDNPRTSDRSQQRVQPKNMSPFDHLNKTLFGLEILF